MAITTYIYHDEYTMMMMIIKDNNTSWDDDEDNNDDAFSWSGTTAIINKRKAWAMMTSLGKAAKITVVQIYTH